MLARFCESPCALTYSHIRLYKYMRTLCMCVWRSSCGGPGFSERYESESKHADSIKHLLYYVCSETSTAACLRSTVYYTPTEFL